MTEGTTRDLGFGEIEVWSLWAGRHGCADSIAAERHAHHPTNEVLSVRTRAVL